MTETPADPMSKPMTFLVDARFVPGADPQPRMADEKNRVQQLREAGVFEQVLVRRDGTGAYLVAVAESTDDLHRHLDTLPFVQDAIMTMRLEEIESLPPLPGQAQVDRSG